MDLANVTSSVVSMVNEDRPSTSEGSMPASTQRGHHRLGGQLALGAVDVLGELRLPDAHDGRCVLQRTPAPITRVTPSPRTAKTATRPEDHRQGEGRSERHPLDVRGSAGAGPG